MAPLKILLGSIPDGAGPMLEWFFPINLATLSEINRHMISNSSANKEGL